MRPSLLDRLGGDAGVVIVAGGWALFAAVFLGGAAGYYASRTGHGTAVALLVGLLFAVVVWLAITLGSLVVTRLLSGAVVSTLLASGGGSVGEREYSEIQTLVARGRTAEARAALLRMVMESPTAVRPREMLAELVHHENPKGAVRLYEEVRVSREATPAQRLHALLRLADLYGEDLERPERARAALREVVDGFPGTRAAEGARAALARSAETSTDPAT